MKISYNPSDINSLVIAAIKFSKDRTATLEKTDKTVKQTPLEFMQKNYPKEQPSLAVYVLSSPQDDRHAHLKAYVQVQMSELTSHSVFIWMRFFANETKFVAERMVIGSHYAVAFEHLAKLIKFTNKPVPIKPAKKAPAKKATKKSAPKANPLAKKTVAELRKMAQKKKIKGYGSMNKAALLKAL